jgi:hypothetical protein
MLRILLAAVVFSAAVPALPVDLGGSWKVVIPGGSQKRPDGSTASWKEIRGTLVVTQKGDTLRAVWRAIDEWTMTGRADADGRFSLESAEREVPVVHDGKRGSATARWMMRGTLNGGALAGTATLVIGDRDPIVHTWTATRSR